MKPCNNKKRQNVHNVYVFACVIRCVTSCPSSSTFPPLLSGFSVSSHPLAHLPGKVRHLGLNARCLLGNNTSTTAVAAGGAAAAAATAKVPDCQPHTHTRCSFSTTWERRTCSQCASHPRTRAREETILGWDLGAAAHWNVSGLRFT